MTAIAQTTMIGACLAILVYIAAITTGNYLATQNMPDNPLSQELQIDDALHKQISTSFNYSHEADTDRTSQTALLNGLNLNPNEFLLLYDSTPYASKGHIALNLPCDANQFGFGRPVTDVVLKNISDRSINMTSPNSVAITTHEAFIPTNQSAMEIQHQEGL